ncbi:hypothetical protein [Kordia sp.]|uniref:hypothetical protein n=1 Tax=Kordia sp. TaxID=1965332 RepID=UPI003D29AD5D
MIITLGIIVFDKGFILIKDISDYPIPKLISKFLIINLALIAFIFSIHSNIYSSHDKYNINVKSQYSWFHLYDILRFPADQFEINQKKYPINIINKNEFIDSVKNRKITIVVDKTGSLIINGEGIEYKKTLKEELMKSLEDKFHKLFDGIDYLKVEDIFLLTALYNIFYDTNYDSNYVQVIFYKGYSKKSKKTFIDLTIQQELKGSDLYNIFKRILDDLKNIKDERYKIGKRATNFHDLARELNKEKIKKNYNGYYSSLVILSDFVHEEVKSNSLFLEVADELNNLSNSINQVNLISFDSSNKNKIVISNRVKSLFRKAFNDLNFYEFQNFLTSNLPKEIQINRMFCSTIQSKEPIILYHSYNNENHKEDYVGKLHLNDNLSTPNLTLSYGFLLKPIRFKSKYNHLLIKSKNNKDSEKIQKLFPFEVGRINKNKHYLLSFTEEKNDAEKIFLEFNHDNKTTILRKPVLLKPVLPITSCVYLVNLYFLSSLSVAFLTFFYAHSIAVKNKNESNTKIRLRYWGLIVISLVFGLSLIILNICNLYMIKEYWISILISILYTFFLVLLFLKSKKY